MNDREERSDPVIGAALRDALGGVPLQQVDWSALHAAVMARTGAASPAWWQFTERWARVLMPLAAAAALASLVFITGSSGGGEATGSLSAGRGVTEETALYAAVGDEQAQTSLMDEVLTSADGGWLFNVRAEN